MIPTGYDAAEALLALVLANIDALNANTYLAESGYAISDAAGDAEGDTSQYKYLRIEDLDILPDGLSLVFVPDRDKDVRRWAPYGSIQKLSVNIYALIQREIDPKRRGLARRGAAQALRTLLNTLPNNQMDLGDGTLYNCRASEANYVNFVRAVDTRMGVGVPCVIIPWSGLISISEDT